MKKRLFALVLVLVLVIGMIPMAAAAIIEPSSALELIIRGNLNESRTQLCGTLHCTKHVCTTANCKIPSCVPHTCTKPTTCTKPGCIHPICTKPGCGLHYTCTDPHCPIAHEVKFYTDGGTLFAPVTVYENGDFSLYTYVPVKFGYTFGGWYYDLGCTKPVVNFKPTCDTILYAKWLANTDPIVSAMLPYMDVPVSSYFYNAVQWANQRGVAASAKYFNPEDTCTRADMITFLWRAEGSPKSNLTYMPFTDVKEGAYYYEAVQWALEAGITKGTNNLKFRPSEIVSRGEVVTMLFRCAEAKAAGENPYTDVSADDWFYDAVRWADANGITKGTNNLKFRPYDDCTRAQVLTFLHRYSGLK